MESPKRKM
jgi:hypothetical protein